MGFFSWDCEYCKHPLLTSAATERHNSWMSSGIAILPNNTIVRGWYDGYGRLDGEQLVDCEAVHGISEPEVYHEACYIAAGEPTIHSGNPPRHSEDQGWFFDNGVHDSPPPGQPGFFICGEESAEDEEGDVE